MCICVCVWVYTPMDKYVVLGMGVYFSNPPAVCAHMCVRGNASRRKAKESKEEAREGFEKSYSLVPFGSCE